MQTIWPVPAIAYVNWREIREQRPVALVYSAAALEAVSDHLSLDVVWRMDVGDAAEATWRAASVSLTGEVVYAVGGGLAVDAAKFLASENGLPVVSLPTALSVDAFFTWASGVRQDGCVRYLETGPPERVVVDLDVLARAPAAVRAAGICDVLSIATGLWDWRYAHELGKNPPSTAYSPWVGRAAEAILDGALACAAAAGRGEPEGLKTLLHTLVLEVQLCNLIGHSRPEEGSEHYFAYAVENVMGKGLPHGDLVGPGILVMAALQGQDVAPLREALRACHIPLTNIPSDVMLRTLTELPAYCARHGLPHGIAHDLDSERIRGLDPDRVIGG